MTARRHRDDIIQRKPMVRSRFPIAAAVVLVCASLSARAQSASPQQASAAIGKYCATCHNARLDTAGLVLDPAAVTDVPAGAERWEKVIRKLRAGSMPPPGAPRPDQSTYAALTAFLETEI